MALHQVISVSSVDQTLKTLLVLDSARQHTAISRFHVRRPTLVIVRLQSPGQRCGTDYNPVVSHSSAFQELTESSCTSSDKPFLFLFHSSRSRAAGALELDSVLRRLRNKRCIITEGNNGRYFTSL